MTSRHEVMTEVSTASALHVTSAPPLNEVGKTGNVRFKHDAICQLVAQYRSHDAA